MSLRSIVSIFIYLSIIYTGNLFSQIIFEKHFSSGFGWCVKECNSGYVVGGTNSSSMLLAKTDFNGNLLWEKHYGDTSGINPEHELNDILVLSDGGFILAGHAKPLQQHFAYFIRTDSLGNELWNLKVPSDINPVSDYYYALKIVRSAYGEFIAAGHYQAANNTNRDYILIRFDSLGNLLGQKHISPGYNENLTDFIFTDSAFYFLGYYSNPYSTFNITKTDTSCNIIHSTDFGTGNSIDIAYSFLMDSIENFYVTGISNDSVSNYFLNEYSISADTLKNFLFPVTNSWQVIYSNCLSKWNNKFIMAGYLSGFSPDEAIITCVDTNGNELFRTNYGGPDHDELYAQVITSDSNILVVGQTTSFNSYPEVYMVKVSPQLILNINSTNFTTLHATYINNEIDFSHFASCNDSKIDLYDLYGKCLYSKNHVENIDCVSLPTAIYILKVECDNEHFVQKIFIQSK